MFEIVRTLTSPDARVKVEIFRRPAGTYGFRAFSLQIEPNEPPQWYLLGHFTESVTAPADDAEREARGRVAGLEGAASADA